MANSIKFSHTYFKIPPNVKTAELVAVVNIALENQTTDFLNYDTRYKTHNILIGYYPLPKSGGYMVLCFKADNGAFFTTIRRYTPEKEKYYRKNIGYPFDIIIEEEID